MKPTYRRSTTNVTTDLKIAAVLRAAGVGVDDAAYWANRIRVALTVVADRRLACAVVARFVADCGVPQAQHDDLTRQLVKAAGR